MLGIGACSSALDRLNIDYEIVDAVEIDKYAIASFNAIHGTSFKPQDIQKWDRNLDDIDIIMHGSPCQDFSIAGKMMGGDIGSGTRSSLMYETIRIVGKIRPKYVIWENVKNLLSPKHKHNFENYLNTMSSLGYNNYYKVLNSKDYGVPQNRERIFTISIRKDIDDETFEFPEKQELMLRLKDVLDSDVEEKYYLKDSQINNIRLQIEEKQQCDDAEKANNSCNTEIEEKPQLVGGIGEINYGKQYRQGNRIYDSDGVAMALLSQPVGNTGGNSYLYKIEEPKVINPLKDKTNYGWHFEQQVYDENGIARAVKAGGGSGNIPKLLTKESETVIRKYGIFDEEDKKHQAGSVFDIEGLCPTLDTMQGGWRQPCIQINKIEIPQTVRVRKYDVDTEALKTLLRESKAKTKITNEEIGNLLGVQTTTVEHWFRRDDCFSIPDAEVWFELKKLLNIETNEFDDCVTVFEEKDNVYEKTNRFYLDNGISPTITNASADEKIITKNSSKIKVRRLTPRECWRLMGFTDEEFDKAEKVNSNSQLYKQAGNSIVVNVLVGILKNIFIKGVEE